MSTANISTKHSPWGYTQTQINEMLWAHSILPVRIRQTMTGQRIVDYPHLHVFVDPENPCGEDCRRCARDRETEDA